MQWPVECAVIFLRWYVVYCLYSTVFARTIVQEAPLHASQVAVLTCMLFLEFIVRFSTYDVAAHHFASHATLKQNVEDQLVPLLSSWFLSKK